MKKTLTISSMTLGCLALAAGLVFAGSGGTPQASITLTNCGAKDCYTHDNKWDLTKSVTGNTVETGDRNSHMDHHRHKGFIGALNFRVHGGLTVTNTGRAPATIGNIVVNLQKPNSPKKGKQRPLGLDCGGRC